MAEYRIQVIGASGSGLEKGVRYLFACLANDPQKSKWPEPLDCSSAVESGYKRMAEYRIQVIGASGSGTSTLGKSRASALAIPHFESDDYFHAPTDPPFQRPRPAEKRYELISRDLRPDQNWVLSGGIVGWLPTPHLDFTCIVFLYVPTPMRIERLRIRELKRFGSRIEEGGDMYGMHTEFIDWASRYDEGDVEGKTLARHEAYLSNQQGTVLVYRGVHPVPFITASVLHSICRS